MSVLGAQTGELVELASQLGSTTGDIEAVNADTRTVSTTVTSEMQDSFGRALTGITNAMKMLTDSVTAANGRLDGTTWTGSNRETFNGAYVNFGSAMGSLDSAVNQAYAEFDGQMKQISGFIDEFQVEVDAAMQQAKESTTSMQTAVNAQRENLESVMNTGLTVG